MKHAKKVSVITLVFVLLVGVTAYGISMNMDATAADQATAQQNAIGCTYENCKNNTCTKADCPYVANCTYENCKDNACTKANCPYAKQTTTKPKQDTNKNTNNNSNTTQNTQNNTTQTKRYCSYDNCVNNSCPQGDCPYKNQAPQDGTGNKYGQSSNSNNSSNNNSNGNGHHQENSNGHHNSNNSNGGNGNGHHGNKHD